MFFVSRKKSRNLIKQNICCSENVGIPSSEFTVAPPPPFRRTKQILKTAEKSEGGFISRGSSSHSQHSTVSAGSGGHMAAQELAFSVDGAAAHSFPPPPNMPVASLCRCHTEETSSGVGSHKQASLQIITLPNSCRCSVGLGVGSEETVVCQGDGETL